MITGTFLDEISHDIPTANWDRLDWARDFEGMKEFGIDTVILIRAGYQDRATFNSRVLRDHHGYLIVQDDLVEMFLELAEKNGMKFFFGTYDSGKYWLSGQPQKEVDLNRAFTEEVWEKYGKSPAFQGWYISHEINSFDENVMRVYEQLATHLRGLAPLPILISPYVRGSKQFENAISLKEHEAEWEQVFARIEGLVDIVAFQDGQVHFHELKDYLQVNTSLARKHGLTSWSNVESFSRDVHIKFPPLDWPKLRFKVDAAIDSGVDKIITFEYSHFMSQYSIFPSAGNLRRSYMKHYRNR